MGPPGVGKGTQAERLKDHLRVPHVSTGDLLRDAVKEGTPMGRKARAFVESGELVPDDLMGDLIAERLGRPDAAEGFILDGFPRTVEQVTILERVLEGLGVKLDRAVALTANEGEIIRRLTGRRICPADGAVYHLESRPPKSPGICDQCGAALVQRADDTEEVIRTRLEVYSRQTLPVMEAYRERGVLLEVDASGTPAEVFERLKAGTKA
jgi:adenylate kinase